MPSVIVDISSSIKKLSKIKTSLENSIILFRNIADRELSDTRLRFKSQVDPSGKKWDDPFTIRRGIGPETGSGARTKTTSFTREEAWGYVVSSRYHATPPGYRFFNKSLGDKIMIDTGALRSRLERTYSKNEAEVGTNIEYARKLQDGIGVKKREFVGVSKKTKQNVEKEINLFLKGLLK